MRQTGFNPVLQKFKILLAIKNSIGPAVYMEAFKQPKIVHLCNKVCKT
jgi:hypothetical protein